MHNFVKTWLLVLALAGTVILTGTLLAPAYVALWISLAVLFQGCLWFYSDRLVRWMHNAKPVKPGSAPTLEASLHALAEKAGLPTPTLYISEDPQPNAFATGRSPSNAAVIVTRGLLGVLSPNETRAVLAHELGHIRHRDTILASMAAVTVTVLGWFSSAMRSRGRSLPGVVWIALFAPLTAGILRAALSRTREFEADRFAAVLCEDPEMLVQALEKLEKANAKTSHSVRPATAALFVVNPLPVASRVMNLFRTHPPLEERTEKLREIAHAMTL